MFSFTNSGLIISFSKFLVSLFKIFTVFFLSNTLYFNTLDIGVLFMLSLTIWGCVYSNNFRYKVKYFLSFLLTVTLFGFMASFDGCILLLLLTEFFILLMFFLIYLTTDKFQGVMSSIPVPFRLFLTTTFLVYFFSVGCSLSGHAYQHFNYYESSLDTVTSDFFILYQFFFITSPLLVIYCGLILSFFIIFFIFFYFKLKQSPVQNKEAIDGINIMRKQDPLRQAKHKAQIRIFRLNVPKR